MAFLLSEEVITVLNILYVDGSLKANTPSVSLKFKCLPYFASEIKRSAIALGIFAPLVALDV